MNVTNTHGRYRHLRCAAAAVTVVATLTGCGAQDSKDRSNGSSATVISSDDDGFNGRLVDPPLRVAPVTLRDTDGNPVRLDELPDDKATAVFFGFTSCDDICPTTMADLASARRSLDSGTADRVAVYFVTVDPERDTPRVLRKWLTRFDPAFVGLRGPAHLVNRVERSVYAAESSRAQGDAGSARHHISNHPAPPEGASTEQGDYGVNHSGSVYVFGPDGATLLYTGGTTVAEYAADFTELLEED